MLSADEVLLLAPSGRDLSCSLVCVVLLIDTSVLHQNKTMSHLCFSLTTLLFYLLPRFILKLTFRPVSGHFTSWTFCVSCDPRFHTHVNWLRQKTAKANEDVVYLCACWMIYSWISSSGWREESLIKYWIWLLLLSASETGSAVMCTWKHLQPKACSCARSVCLHMDMEYNSF